MDVLGYTYDELINRFAADYGKGEYHAGSLFRTVFQRNSADLAGEEHYLANPFLAETVSRDFPLILPPVASRRDEDGVIKFRLDLGKDHFCESVIIPMAHYNTLCISSQVGCGRGCRFCETARLGFARNLTTAEIIAQIMTAVFVFQRPVSNLVFMGMGEPFDNYDAVLKAICIVSDQRGLNIPRRKMTISTCGNVDGIRRFAELASEVSFSGFHTIRLAVSLNAADDETRSFLMPVNRIWNMTELQAVLKKFPVSNANEGIFIEYVLIPGINDGTENAVRLAAYLEEVPCQVNLIPYNPRQSSPFRKPEPGDIELFFDTLVSSGLPCRIRDTRGERIGAACGMLGNNDSFSFS